MRGKKLILIEKKLIRFHRLISNQTKIDFQIWTAWNPNCQQFDSPNRLSFLKCVIGHIQLSFDPTNFT